MSRLAALFATPARQALAWTTLGILGVIFAAIGAWLLIRSGDAPPAAPGVSFTPTPTTAGSPSPTTTPTPTPSPTPTPATPTPTATATPRPTVVSGSGGSTGGQSGSAPVPTPTPTPEPAAARPYCPPGALGPGTLPTARVAGALTRGGVPVPAGTLEVFVTFDGVPGPSRLNVDGGFGIDFYTGGESCANRVGAVIGVLVDGRYFPSPYTIGAQPELVVINVELP
ncbi:hypothetical protein [Tepidiforma thermophila]|uniref:Uncharacterized protein n=1 Tax=Tepidiforma thermophila (strain KCTC 52669 / CGMCC 1.13589 / G233) TaxID=2761530 RepID=A0A2A9HGS3_TEPT2|nr:hypothetical protein [Tepidiforma thermophila]PFG74019.1 hypothetical protein A9A59_1227 [Tepidiforma thermophila]